MATKFGNIKGVKWVESPRGENAEAIVLITFDLLGIPYTAGSDTIQLGGGGAENGQVTTATLAEIIQNRRRDGRTVTLGQVMGAEPGLQGEATNGRDIFPQGAVVAGANVIGVTLQSAVTAGNPVTTTTAPWDAAAALLVSYSAPPLI